MKFYKLWHPLLLIFFFSCSCKKKISDSPGFPPAQQYFNVSSEKQQFINNKQLIINKISSSGETVFSKNVTEVIPYSGQVIFRIANSWEETTKLFNQGLNVFYFNYGDSITDTVTVNVSFQENNQITFTEVKYNSQVIMPEISDYPAHQSKIFTIK